MIDAEICKFQLAGPFSVTQAGTTGCVVRDGNGNIVAWTENRAMALIIAGLLESCFQQSE